MARQRRPDDIRQGALFTGSRPRRPVVRPGRRAGTRRTPTPIRTPGKKIWLSATGIETHRRCPRCFWLQYNLRIYQPEGIVSRLANRFDGVIKRYFDLYRGTNELPPLVAGQVVGRLESPFQELYFATLNQRYGFKGKLDECLVRPDGRYTPVDHKTASSDPNTREIIPAYQFQLDSYAWLLGQNEKPTSGLGHLIYFYPAESQHLHQGFPMEVTIKTLTTKPTSVRPILEQAISLLEGPLPAPADDCPFCLYVEQVKRF
ncbi:MAG: PD-(D/E)XK nuclease family protein [Candidatus Kerfeldbacteria bacterium]|nr:PD-(D/E)XK nuclease family protein [Candidatus Kerfeldbacteria bacterium]